MSDATSPIPVVPAITAANLDTFARVDVLGLEVQAQQVWPDKTILFCKPTLSDDTLNRPGKSGDSRCCESCWLQGLWL